LDIRTIGRQTLHNESQFAQIELALKTDPTSEELIGLKKEILEVVNLTDSLLKIKRKAAVPSGDIAEKKISPTTPFMSSSSSSSNGSLGITKEITKKEESLEEMEDDGEEGEEETGNMPIKANKKFVTPKSLQIFPTDSEEVRNQKRRKRHILKSKWRVQQMENQRTIVKNTWKEFNTQASKKPKVVGYFTGRTKESIFKSPDSVEGKVGVIGSGKPLTPMTTFKSLDVKRKVST